MAGFVMALLTDAGRAKSKEPHIIAPVRQVTIQAIFPYRGMFPQERTAGIGMAPITGFVDTVVRNEFLGDRTVDVVTIGALHFAFADRMMRPIVSRRGRNLMTLAAQLQLSRNVQVCLERLGGVD
jgi:hypothetical protein